MAPTLVLHEKPPLAAASPPQSQPCRGARMLPLLVIAGAGFAYMTIFFGVALYRSRGDPGFAAFVALVYAYFLLGLCYVAEPGWLRGRLRRAVCLLTNALTLAFSCAGVAAVLPLPLAAVTKFCWAMSLALAAGSFVIFCFNATRGKEMAVDGKTPHTAPPRRSSSPVSALALGLEQEHPSPNAHAPIEQSVCGVISP